MVSPAFDTLPYIAFVDAMTELTVAVKSTDDPPEHDSCSPDVDTHATNNGLASVDLTVIDEPSTDGI
jgi:hypothetical protein